jgi:ribosomal protein L7/L12
MADAPQQIAELIRQGKKSEAIKLLRDTTGLGLREAKEEIERISSELAGQQPLPLHAMDSGMHEVSQEVLALAHEGKKIEAIKLLREQTGLGLKESKEKVDALMGQSGGGCASVVLFIACLAGVLLYL